LHRDRRKRVLTNPVLRLVAHAMLVVPLVSGCAAYRTLADAELGSPKVMSGTRLDAAALARDDVAQRRFKSPPPAYPGLDLPFSAALDIIALPVTVPAAAYEAVFY
jgi:uncharacterized protein YceK